MGEAKNRANSGYKPPDGMERENNPALMELSSKIQELIQEACNNGMHASVASQVTLLTALDVWRFNLGDSHAKEVFVKCIDQRLAFPLEYWYGATSN